MLGYLLSPRIGSAVYNLAHTYTAPILLAVVAIGTERHLLLAIATIWVTHIAFDRLAGYGLKYPTQFKDSHLQRLD